MIPLPANVKLFLALLIVGSVGALNALAKVESTWNWIGSVVSLLAVLETFFTTPPSASLKIKALETTLAATVKPLAVLALLVFVGVSQSACATLSTAPVVPVTQANQTQVNDCEAEAELHNGVVIGDYVFGGGATATAAVIPFLSDTNTKNTLGGIAAGAAGIAAIGAAVAGFEAANYANGQCSTVLGNLQAQKSKKSSWLRDPSVTWGAP
jgi:hypothetical protein